MPRHERKSVASRNLHNSRFLSAPRTASEAETSAADFPLKPSMNRDTSHLQSANANMKSTVYSGETGLANRDLLDKVDHLFACGVGDYISLPQLVVVGDQSSGKSSVLEGLTDLPFPRDAGLCTRFATQIIFRRAQQEAILVSVIPAKDASPEHMDKLRSWKKDLSSIDSETFTEIMHEVQELMDIGEGSLQTFSSDVLKLELAGPQREHFSVIDVPGIFRVPTKGKTTEADIQFVRSMVLSYMKNPRSIMLAVLAANVDITNQEILTLADNLDAGGQRTLGVLTKPDLVDEGSERQVLDLIKGEQHSLALGWHIVRNPGQKELGNKSAERHPIEAAFFEEKVPWKYVEKSIVGISALKGRLQEVLQDHVMRDFPKVRSELNQALKERHAALRILGPARSTYAEQLPYLIAVANDFQRLLAQAKSTHYSENDAFDTHADLRLATRVVARNDEFSDCMALNGTLYKWNLSATAQGEKHSSASAFVDSRSSDSADEADEDDADDAKFISVRTLPAIVNGLLETPEWVQMPKTDGILAWLDGIYVTSRGFEIGTFQASIIPNTMKTQSEKWPDIARGYISDVIGLCHKFIQHALEITCPERRVREKLRAALVPELSARYRKAVDRVDELLEVERSEPPLTVNHYLNDNLQKARETRFRKAMGIDTYNNNSTYRGKDLVANLMSNLSSSMSNRDHMIREIHDTLQAYYKVARKRFVDNVCKQAVGHFLINGSSTPLNLLTADLISKMKPEQVQAIAGEEHAARQKRERLHKEIANLEEGKKYLV